MPGPAPLNSACNCCSQPPSPHISVEYASIQQSCTASGVCGFVPCTSTDAVFNDKGECVTPAQICEPDFASLSRAEKCSGKKYLTKTITHRDGHTETTTCTVNEDGGCDCETTCSGSYTVTEETESTVTVNESVPSDDGSITGSGTASTTIVTTVTYKSDCSTTSDLTCSGSANSDVTSSYWGGTEVYTDICEGSFVKGRAVYDDVYGITTVEPCGDEDCTCMWDSTLKETHTIEGAVESDETSSGAFYCLSGFNGVETTSTTTQDPEPVCEVRTVFSNENTQTQSNCHPKTLPPYPAFIDCTREGEEPPESPELEPGQGRSHTAYKYQNPHNSVIKSEQRVKFRVVHGPSGTCYLKVWFRKVKQKYKYEDCDTGFPGDPPRTAPWNVNCNPPGNPPPLVCTSRWSTNGEPTYEGFGDYDWNGSGYPCFEDDSKQPNACENTIYMSQSKELVAGENESVTLQIKWSLIKDYEPNWPDKNGCQGCKPNGFPIADPDSCCNYEP
jgi:hypothetical protein